uniref:Uncharacterized protein n=1 Tax=Globodera rostochiensis TaxID=31243 RepID=A0A914HSS5_GLORO
MSNKICVLEFKNKSNLWENGAPSAQERVYYANTTESFVPGHFNPNNQLQGQYQAFTLPQPVQDGFVPQPWPYQHPVQGAQMELEMELQKVKLSGQYAKVLKELPILNGTEGREAILDFFTALETRTTEWSSEKIMEVMQIKVKGKAREEAAAAVTRFGNTISLKDLRFEIAKALYGEERLEKGPQQDRRAEPISHHRLSAGEELDVGVELESQNQQILEKNPSQNNFLDNVSFGEFGQTTFAPKKLPLEISFTSEETVQFVNLKRLRASSVSPIQSFFWETPVHGTRMLQPACCLKSSSGNLPGDHQPQLNRKSEKEEVPPKRADKERIKTLEKQLELVSKERDKLKTLVESFIEGKETNRKSRKVLAHKLRKIFPVEKTEKTVTTGKSDLAKKMAHSSDPKIVQNPSEILGTPPTRGPIPFPNSVKSHQKEPAGKVVRSNVFETGRRTGFGRVFVNSALKRPQATQNLCQRSPKRKNPGVSSQNIRKRENSAQNPGRLHRGVRVFVNSRYKRQSERSDPPSSAPIAPQNRWCLNKTPQLPSAHKSQFEARVKGIPPPPQSNFQGHQPPCSTGQHQQVDEDATLEGDGGGRTNRR